MGASICLTRLFSVFLENFKLPWLSSKSLIWPTFTIKSDSNSLTYLIYFRAPFYLLFLWNPAYNIPKDLNNHWLISDHADDLFLKLADDLFFKPCSKMSINGCNSVQNHYKSRKASSIKRHFNECKWQLHSLDNLEGCNVHLHECD